MATYRKLVVLIALLLSATTIANAAPNLEEMAVGGQSAVATLRAGEPAWNTGSIVDVKRKLFLKPDNFISVRFNDALRETDANYAQQIFYYAPKGRVPYQSAETILKKLLELNTLSSARMLRGDGSNVLFKSIRLYQDAEFKTVIPSLPTLSPFPQKFVAYAKITDSNFGPMRYRIDYEKGPDDALAFALVCLDKASYWFKSVANPGRLIMSWTALPLADGGTLYGAQVAVNIVDYASLKETIDLASYFSRRVEGLKEWYFNQIYGLKVPQGKTPVGL